MKRWIHASSSLDKLYRGIWYGAKSNPMPVRELLDRIVSSSGRGFTISVKKQYDSDNLLDNSATVQCYLVDEEGRGRFKLSDEAVDYLIENLPQDSWLYDKLVKVREEQGS